MDTGRVDPRVRVKADLAGRVGSGRNFWNALFFSLCQSASVSLAIAPNIEFCKKVSKYVAKQNVDFYSASTS